jgi:hypothetical protein
MWLEAQIWEALWDQLGVLHSISEYTDMTRADKVLYWTTVASLWSSVVQVGIQEAETSNMRIPIQHGHAQVIVLVSIDDNGCNYY